MDGIAIEVDEIFYYWDEEPDLVGGHHGLGMRSTSAPTERLRDWDGLLRPFLSDGGSGLTGEGFFYARHGGLAAVGHRSPDPRSHRAQPIVHAVCGRADLLTPDYALIIAQGWWWLRDLDELHTRGANRLSVSRGVDVAATVAGLSERARRLAQDDLQIIDIAAAALASPSPLSIIGFDGDPLPALWALLHLFGGSAPRDGTFSTLETADHDGRGHLPSLVFLPRSPEPSGFGRSRAQLNLTVPPPVGRPAGAYRSAAEDLLTAYGDEGEGRVRVLLEESGWSAAPSVDAWVQRLAGRPRQRTSALRLLQQVMAGSVGDERLAELPEMSDRLPGELRAISDDRFDALFGAAGADRMRQLEPLIGRAVGAEALRRALRRAACSEQPAELLAEDRSFTTAIAVADDTGQVTEREVRQALASHLADRLEPEQALRLLRAVMEFVHLRPGSPEVRDLMGGYGRSFPAEAAHRLGPGTDEGQLLITCLAGVAVAGARDGAMMRSLLARHPDFVAELSVGPDPEEADEEPVGRLDVDQRVADAIAETVLTGVDGAGLAEISQHLRSATTPLEFCWAVLHQLDRYRLPTSGGPGTTGQIVLDVNVALVQRLFDPLGAENGAARAAVVYRLLSGSARRGPTIGSPDSGVSPAAERHSSQPDRPLQPGSSAPPVPPGSPAPSAPPWWAWRRARAWRRAPAAEPGPTRPIGTGRPDDGAVGALEYGPGPAARRSLGIRRRPDGPAGRPGQTAWQERSTSRSDLPAEAVGARAVPIRPSRAEGIPWPRLDEDDSWDTVTSRGHRIRTAVLATVIAIALVLLLGVVWLVAVVTS